MAVTRLARARRAIVACSIGTAWVACGLDEDVPLVAAPAADATASDATGTSAPQDATSSVDAAGLDATLDAGDDAAAEVADVVAIDVVDDGDAVADVGADAQGDADADADAALAEIDDGTFTIPAGKVCTRDGFCWEHPVPQGNWVNGVWGTSASNVWAVSALGTLLHFDGAAWSGVVLGPVDSYRPVPNGVAVTTFSLDAVAGTGPSDVWAVGARGRILHFDGTSWSTTFSGEPTTTFTAVSASSPANAWAVGRRPESGTIVRWNGSQWSRMESGVNLTTLSLMGVVAYAPNDVWAAGTVRPPYTGLDQGVVLHFDGSSWSENKRVSGESFLAMWGGADASLAIAGQDAIQYDGTIRRRAGGVWSLESTPATYVFLSLAGSSPEDLWATSYPGGLWHTEDAGWRKADASAGNTLSAIWMGGPSVGWAVGASGAMRSFDGGAWSSQAPLATTLTSVWGASKDSVWLGGQHGGFTGGAPAGGVVLHWNGSALAVDAAVPARTVTDISGTADDDVWAVGADGWIGHRTTTWSTVPSPISAMLTSVHASSPTNAWAVGHGGVILHYQGGDAGIDGGSPWESVASGTTQNLLAVHVLASGYAIAAGEGGAVLEWKGAGWSAIATGSAQTYRAVWATSESDIWLAGDASKLLHWNGSVWETPPGLPTGLVFGLYGAEANKLWAVGDVVMVGSGNQWTQLNAGTSSVAQTRPFAVWSGGGETWIVGGAGTAVRRVEKDGG